MSSPNEDLTHAIKILLMNWGPYKTKGKWTFSQCGPAPVRRRREVGHGVPTRFHEDPLQKPLEILAFLRGRLWNSTGGHSAQDADLINSTKILLIHWGPYETKENEHFHSMVPAHGDTAAERTTARTFGSRSVCQMRHMGIIEKP